MKYRLFGKTITMIATLSMAGMLIAGCGSTEADTQQTAAPYFTKGVYVNYSEELENPDLTYFYVFSTDDYGYTADGAAGGIGVPFDVISQADGRVTMSVGGADSESEEVLIVTAVDANGTVHAYYEDIPERPMVFELLSGVDVDTFSAENYVNGPEDSVYHDANGWSVKYNADLFEVTPGGPVTTFVYTGESAGTNMITVTYTADNKAEAAIKEMGESWGEDTYYNEGPFPGAEDVTGYWASLAPSEDGSGLYETALARDYMDGALIFELTGHNGEDDEMNMAVSDAMAGVIDSITFDEY